MLITVAEVAADIAVNGLVLGTGTPALGILVLLAALLKGKGSGGVKGVVAVGNGDDIGEVVAMVIVDKS